MAFPGTRPAATATASFSIPAAESFLRTFSPPVLGLNGDSDNTPYIFVGLLRPPPRTALAASSLSSQRAPREVYISQPGHSVAPTILVLDPELQSTPTTLRGVPSVHFPYNSQAHAVALYWRLLAGLQHALAQSSATGAPVDPVTIYREILRDYEYSIVVLGQNRNVHADKDCWVTSEGEGMSFRSVAGENAENFFKRQIGPEARVLQLTGADVRQWAHSYPAQVDMMMSMEQDNMMSMAVPEMAAPASGPVDMTMEMDAAFLAPLTPQTTRVAGSPHALPTAALQQSWMETAMNSTTSKKRKLVEATTESCRKMARLIAKPHFRTRQHAVTA